MKRFTILFLFFCSISLHSQTIDLGQPNGWNGRIITKKNIPVKVMSRFNQSLINSEDVINDALKDRPWRFGYKYDVNYSTKNSGIWTTLPNGDKLWQLSIECKNALTINLILENYYLPKGAYLYLYDEDRTNKVGAYTSINNKEDGELGGRGSYYRRLCDDCGNSGKHTPG